MVQGKPEKARKEKLKKGFVVVFAGLICAGHLKICSKHGIICSKHP
jgi:hypothetical protein